METHSSRRLRITIVLPFRRTSWIASIVVQLFGLSLPFITLFSLGAPGAQGQCSSLPLAQQQLIKTLNYIDSSHFPQYTVLNTQKLHSSWYGTSITEWTSGFFPGWLWYMYEQSLDPSLLARAQVQTASLLSEATDNSSHDIGFRIMASYGNGYAVTGDPAYMKVIQTAAQTLSTLYVAFPDGGGTINSWPAYSSKVNVIIDNMMNLELLFFAAQNGGNSAWYNMAVNHALKTMQNLVRPDGSTYQGVQYDPDGSVYQHFTSDGYSVNSTWSRGQAWGLTGFTIAYRYTRDSRFLVTARTLANYFLAHIPSDFVPYWDFSRTDYKDSSAAAIAATGLLELSNYVVDPDKTTYRSAALSIQNSLSSANYLGNPQSTDGVLIHGTYAVPFNVGLDTSLIWGDYYYIQGCYRAMTPPPQVSGLMAANVAYNQVPLTWQAQTGAVRYNIKRGTVSGGPYTTIAPPPVLTANTYVDMTVAPGTTYYYLASAANVAGEGPPSSELVVTTPPAPSGSGIALVQSRAVEGSAVSSLSAAFPSANIRGNLLVAFVRMSTTSQTVAVSDTTGNAYTLAVSQGQTADGHQTYIFYAANIAGGANTVKATFSGANNHPWLAIYEFSGVSTLDRVAAAQGWSALAAAGPTASTSSANELLFAAVGLPASYTGTATAANGFTLLQQDTGTSRAANETSVVSATGSFTGGFTLSSATNWTALIATFSAAAPPPTPPTITTTSLPAGTQNKPYSATLSATGGAAPYTWSVTAGSLSAGLALAPATGTISGTPTASGTANFTVQVKDSNAQTGTRAFSLTINPNSAGGNIALVQAKALERSGVSSVSLSFSSPNTQGNLIVAFVRMSTTSQTVSVFDSAGNVYARAVSQSQTYDGHQVHIFYASNIAGAGNTVTAAFSGINNHPWVAIHEYSGVTTLDRTAAAQGWGASAASGASSTTSSANELVFAATGLPASYTGLAAAGAGFTLVQQDTGTSRAANETAVASATGSFTGVFNLSASANWTAVIATFRP